MGFEVVMTRVGNPWLQTLVCCAVLTAFSQRVIGDESAVPPELIAISQQVQSIYSTAKPTADGTDLEAAGAVLVLQKNNLIMNKVQLLPYMTNVYKDEKIGPEGLFGVMGKVNAHLPKGILESNSRVFKSGEKFWVIAIQVFADGLYFFLMSDPIDNQRYHARLKFMYPKGSTPTPEAIVSLVSEVLKVDDSGNTSQESVAAEQSLQDGSAVRQSGTTPAESKIIAIGQSRDQVIAAFGVPQKIVQLGAKEIDYFADMKVTFVKSKVTDVN